MIEYLKRIFREFKEEILRKSKEYIEKVIYKNSECKYFSELKKRIDDLETVCEPIKE